MAKPADSRSENCDLFFILLFHKHVKGLNCSEILLLISNILVTKIISVLVSTRNVGAILNMMVARRAVN